MIGRLVAMKLEWILKVEILVQESCCAIPCMDSLNVGISSAFFHFSSTGRFLRSCRKYGLRLSGILIEDGMKNPGTISDVAGYVGWEDSSQCISLGRSYCSV